VKGLEEGDFLKIQIAGGGKPKGKLEKLGEKNSGDSGLGEGEQGDPSKEKKSGGEKSLGKRLL